MPVKGIANATEVHVIDVEIAGTPYHVEILKDPTAKVWNELKTTKPGESAFDLDTRVLLLAIQSWDLGLEVTKEACEDLQEVVRATLVHLITRYYLDLQKAYQEVLARIYRPGGDGQTDPSLGSAPVSVSPVRSKASRRTA